MLLTPTLPCTRESTVDDKRPTLKINLSGEDGNVFVVIGAARALLISQALEHFNTDIGTATLVETGTTYQDVLAIVNRYVELIDTSGLYPEYARPRDEQAIMAAVNRLNEQLRTIPYMLYCPIEGLYPEFDYPDCGPEVYLVMVEQEIASVDRQIEQARAEYREPLERLKAMLEECAEALKKAGV
jgi:hypothetical protein